MACQYDVIKHMLLKLILSGTRGKWAYAIVGYDLAYKPLRLMKGQVVADFIVDYAVDVDHSVGFVQLKPWELFFDGSVCSKGQGVGCVIVSPNGACVDLSIRLEFACTNNHTRKTQPLARFTRRLARKTLSQSPPPQGWHHHQPGSCPRIRHGNEASTLNPKLTVRLVRGMWAHNPNAAHRTHARTDSDRKGMQ
jgi:HAMP domain-containing protein